MLDCSSLSGRYSSKCSFAKEAIDFDILYLYHLSSGTTLNLLIAGSLSDESLSDVVLVADEEEEEYFLFGIFSLLGRGKVVLGLTLTPPPIAIFAILGRVALRWASTLFSFPVIYATMAWRCVGCYYWNL